jgi:hypothetical protein
VLLRSAWQSRRSGRAEESERKWASPMWSPGSRLRCPAPNPRGRLFASAPAPSSGPPRHRQATVRVPRPRGNVVHDERRDEARLRGCFSAWEAVATAHEPRVRPCPARTAKTVLHALRGNRRYSLGTHRLPESMAKLIGVSQPSAPPKKPGATPRRHDFRGGRLASIAPCHNPGRWVLTTLACEGNAGSRRLQLCLARHRCRF